MKKLFLLFSFVGLLLATSPVLAQMGPIEDPYYGLDETADQAGIEQRTEAPVLIGNIIGNVLTLIGVLFFGLMVYGGFLWMTAHGDSGQVDKAKETIIAAIIGIVVVLFSYSLTLFVMGAPTGGQVPTNTGNSPQGGNGPVDRSGLGNERIPVPNAPARPIPQ